jgi:lysophospholipase L1-like esterase
MNTNIGILALTAVMMSVSAHLLADTNMNSSTSLCPLSGPSAALGVPWGDEFTDTVPWPIGKGAHPAALRHRVGERHLVDNLEWREGADGYFCSSHAHFSFVTEATELVFESTDAAHGSSANPVVLNGGQVVLTLPSLPADQRLQFVPLSLPPGVKRLTVVNSALTHGSWVEPPKGQTVRSIFSTASLRWLPPDPALAKTRLVIYGDSIAVGGGPVLPGVEGWGALLRRDYDIAFDGSGWHRLSDDRDRLPEVADRMARYRPAIVWIAIGVNDYQGPGPMDATNYARIYGHFLDVLHDRLPDALVVAQSPLAKADEGKPNSAGLTLADYRAIMKTAVDNRPWCRYVDGAPILALPDLLDGVHPHAAGMARYAQWAGEYLKGLARH